MANTLRCAACSRIRRPSLRSYRLRSSSRPPSVCPSSPRRNAAVRLVFSEGELVLDAGHTDDAQASEAIEATVEGGEITVAFNPSFLLDGLSALDAPYVRMGFTQDTKPVDFVGLDKPDGTPKSEFRYLLVPIRIAG